MFLKGGKEEKGIELLQQRLQKSRETPDGNM
jgi:hypothetical protein